MDERNCIIRSFIIYTPQEILLGYSYEEGEIGGVCKPPGRDKCTQKFDQETEGKRPLDRRIKLEWEGVD